MDCDITWYPMFGAPERIEVAYGQGGHGGGDALILEELFGNPGPVRLSGELTAMPEPCPF